MTTDDPGTPPYGGQQPPYGVPPQQPPYGQQQPQYFPPPQGGYGGPQQPPTGPYQWQQPGGQQPRPPRRKHTARNVILGIVGAFVLIIVIAAVASNSGNKNTPASSSTSQPPAGTSASTGPSAAPAQAALTNTGADGDFKFTVTGWSCGATASNEVYGSADGFASQPAGTTECVATLSVTNVHDSAQSFWQNNQYAINLRGQKLSADNNTIYASGTLGQDNVQINPGQTATVAVAYAVPNGQTIAKLELHDSAFSSGIDVKP